MEKSPKKTAGPYEVCPDCVGGNFTPAENARSCKGPVHVELLGRFVCGKQLFQNASKDIAPELWKVINE